MKLRRVRITENSEQDAAEFVILPGLREQACRRGIRRLTALESDRRKIEETYLKAVDIGYSYRLAKKMEEFKSNPVLGYRTAGSKAEFDTGEFLKAEMERIWASLISIKMSSVWIPGSLRRRSCGLRTETEKT